MAELLTSTSSKSASEGRSSNCEAEITGEASTNIGLHMAGTAGEEEATLVVGKDAGASGQQEANAALAEEPSPFAARSAQVVESATPPLAENGDVRAASSSTMHDRGDEEDLKVRGTLH